MLVFPTYVTVRVYLRSRMLNGDFDKKNDHENLVTLLISSFWLLKHLKYKTQPQMRRGNIPRKNVNNMLTDFLASS